MKLIFSCQENEISTNDDFCKTGNYIVFFYNQKTIVYELLLKSKATMENYISQIKKIIPEDQLQFLNIS